MEGTSGSSRRAMREMISLTTTGTQGEEHIKFWDNSRLDFRGFWGHLLGVICWREIEMLHLPDRVAMVIRHVRREGGHPVSTWRVLWLTRYRSSDKRHRLVLSRHVHRLADGRLVRARHVSRGRDERWRHRMTRRDVLAGMRKRARRVDRLYVERRGFGGRVVGATTRSEGWCSAALLLIMRRCGRWWPCRPMVILRRRFRLLLCRVFVQFLVAGRSHRVVRRLRLWFVRRWSRGKVAAGCDGIVERRVIRSRVDSPGLAVELWQLFSGCLARTRRVWPGCTRVTPTTAARHVHVLDGRVRALRAMLNRCSPAERVCALGWHRGEFVNGIRIGREASVSLCDGRQTGSGFLRVERGNDHAADHVVDVRATLWPRAVLELARPAWPLILSLLVAGGRMRLHILLDDRIKPIDSIVLRRCITRRRCRERVPAALATRVPLVALATVERLHDALDRAVDESRLVRAMMPRRRHWAIQAVRLGPARLERRRLRRGSRHGRRGPAGRSRADGRRVLRALG